MSQDHQTVVHITIDRQREGQRIDNFLISQLRGVPKTHIYKILRKGEVRVNKRRVKPHYKLRCGDAVRVPPMRTTQPSEIDIGQALLDRLWSSLLFESDDLLVINKPAGLAVHGGSGVNVDLSHCLKSMFLDQSVQIAHRLDRQTSGCLVCAKNIASLRRLQQAFHDGVVKKNYWTLVKGLWQVRDLHVALELQKLPGAVQGGKMRIEPSGKPALTTFSARRYFPSSTLMSVQLATGRTHQIRVHAMSQGHPVAGDDKYGDKSFNQTMRSMGLKRLFLHAAEIVIPKSVLGEQVSVSAPLPEPLQEFMQRLSNSTV